MVKKIKNKAIVAYLKFIKHPWQGYCLRKSAGLIKTDILSGNHFYFLGIVAILKGEDNYLVEWIEFHKMMGVEHFILYDNGLEKNTEVILSPYKKSGLVTHILFPHVKGSRDGKHVHTIRTQQLAYADAIIRFKNHFQYLLQLDIDEFMFPKNDESILSILKKLDPKKIKGLEIQHTNFGNNYHIKKPSGLVTENYLLTSTSNTQNSVKSIGNTKFFSKFSKYTNIHQFSYRLSIIDLIKKMFTGYPKKITGTAANNLFQLNHYYTKSQEEYLNKSIVNKKGWMTGKETKEKFIIINNKLNKIQNNNIARFIPKLKENIKLHNIKL